MTAWDWLVVALSALLIGTTLLVADRLRLPARGQERRRWAARQGWHYVKADSRLPHRWACGGLGLEPARAAQNVVSGRLLTDTGGRPVLVFDHQWAGRAECTVFCVHRNPLPDDVVIELWSEIASIPEDPNRVLVGALAQRYAYVTGWGAARPLITAELLRTCQGLGKHVPVVWCEHEWVLATTPLTSSRARLDRTLRILTKIADQLDSDGLPQSPHRNGAVKKNPVFPVEYQPAASGELKLSVTELFERPMTARPITERQLLKPPSASNSTNISFPV